MNKLSIYIMKVTRIFLVSVLTLGLISGFSQNGANKNYLPNFVPPSPEAASLGQYGEHPVSYFTGIPSISIPLFEITSGNINVPISLSYHASGIKVEQVASRVGMGWSLNAGGVITRTAAGYNDDLGSNRPCLNGALCDIYGYFDLPANYNLTSTDPDGDIYDSEPDPHYYNIPGRSGKFFFKNRSSYILTRKENIKIESPYDGGSFEIWTEDGLIYRFDAVERTFAGGTCTSNRNLDYNSSWYLTEIIDQINGRTVTFTYTTMTGSINGQKSYNKSYANIDCFGFNPSGSCSNFSSTSSVKVLSRIDYDQGYVLFETANRLDLDNDQHYTAIKKYNNAGDLEKGYSFGTSFVNATGGLGEKSKRLFLHSISEIADNGVTTEQRYSFDYINEHLLPSRDSKEQDVWGYFNDNNATTFDPAIYLYSSSFGRDRFSIYNDSYRTLLKVGADRTPNTTTMAYGTLNKITYPTKGYSVFEYEPHTYSSSRIGAGLRVSRITNYESDGTFLKRKKYVYTNGKLPGAPPQLAVPNGTSGVSTFYRNRAHLGSNEGGFIGYDNVLEYTEDISGNNLGAIQYEYMNIPDQEPAYIIKDDCDNINKYSYYPFFNWISNEIQRGVLDKVTYWEKGFNQATVPTKIVDYTYKHIAHEDKLIKMGAATLGSVGGGLKFTAERRIKSERMLLTSEIETVDGVDMTTTYTYFEDYGQEFPNGIHNLAMKTRTVTVGDGSSIKSEYKYPFNFVGSASGGAMGLMGDPNNANYLHYVSPVIQEDTWRIDGSGTRLISSQINDFEIQGTGSNQYVRPSSIQVAKITNPIISSSIVTVADPSTPTPLYEPRVEFLEYSAYKRPSLIRHDNKYLRLDWKNHYLLRSQEIVTSANQYTFLRPPQGWNEVVSATSKTKDSYYTYSVASSFPNLDISQGYYYLSFWAKDGTFNFYADDEGDFSGTAPSTWTRYTRKIVGTGELYLTGTAKMASLRVYQYPAQITTYHYDKFNRLIAITDPSNTVTSFEYDGFGRLMNQKDTNDDIEIANYYNFK